MSERAKAFWLGIFILGGTALAIWLLLFIKPSGGDEGQTLRVRFANVDKISVGTQVTFAGRVVGEVKEIHLAKNSREESGDAFGNLYFYELVLGVDSSVRVFTYDLIIYATAGLLGEKSVAILPKSPPPGSPPACDVTKEILFGRSVDRLEEAVSTISSVAQTLDQTMEKIGTFLSYNHEEFHETLLSLHAATEQLATFVETANTSELAARLSDASFHLSHAADKIDRFFGDAVNARLIDNLNYALASVGDVAQNLNSGRGTLGRLLADESFQNQISAMITKLDMVFSDINNYGLLFQYDKKWQRLQRQRYLLMH